MNARSILMASEDSATALSYVERASSYLNLEQFDGAAAAIADARAELFTRLNADPAVMAALAGAETSIARLATIEAEDAEIGVKERGKIELFERAVSHDDEVRHLLAADLKLSREYVAQRRGIR